jgi:hypothetical protein
LDLDSGWQPVSREADEGALEVARVRRTDGSNSAPSWQDYIDALKEEGRRYRPESLRAVLEERERKAGKPSARDEGQK